ncbi:MAG: amino acid adenylation domain-containing protein, partial [Acidobacteriota bacterium]|nr:amino acid adenylation domain-containing protein [Acidobacteriota bacterium]
MAKSRDVEDLYPASPMQMAMLFEEEANPDRRTYVHQRTWGLRGPLDAAALAAAWQAVVDRHPILRTCFVWKSSDVPVQVVFRRVRFTLQQEDWTDCDDREQQRRLRRFLDDDRRRGFETRRAPLTRGALLRLAEDRHLFVWTQHHLLLDAWSYPLVLEEVFHSYQTLRRNLTVELPPRPPYRNYIAWLQRQNGSAGEAYWQDQLKDVEQATPLGIPRRGSRRQGFGAVARALPAELSSALDSFARRSRVTLNTLVEAAWSLLLGCYSGRRRVVFGAVVSGRPPSLAGADAMIGLFINTQPVPVRLDPRRQLASWLQELFDQRSEARRWEHLPLSTVRKQSAVAAGRPLFESLVSFQNMPSEEGLAAAVPELVIEEGQVVEEPGLPLILVAMPGPRTVLEAQYDRASLDAVGARRLLAHLEVLLSAMARRPDARLGELSPLTAAERQQTLVEWNDTAVPAPPVDLYQLVRRQAQAAPRAPALVEEDETLDQQIVDYGELLQRVEALAQRLRRAGVGPGELVAVVVRRGAPLAEAMLAVMAAGGVVLPLDSEHPPQRLRELLDIARPRAVVAGEDRAAVVPEELVRIAPRGDSSGSPAPELPSRLSASSGYAFFTSGSSGFPKAVVTGSAAASSFAVMTARRLGLGAGDRMLQFASPAFDVVLEEIFPPLLSGATVIFPPADPLVHLRDFEQLLARRQITVVELPAGFWERWVEDLEARGSAPPASLRCLLLGCDRPSARALEAWIQLGGPPVLSVFGLTETGVTNALQPYPGGEAENLPIGRPVDNHRLYIVGPRGRPLPPAVTGELWIAGAGLARGYRGRPAATAERFVPDPWSPTGGERIYRTGDRARWRLDGRLEFLGRLDRQLKVRGVRVEPAEVETVLTSHQQVTAGSVVPRRGAAGEVALAAFVVAADPAPDSSELRQHLGQSLPEAMVPTHWTFLDELPLTSRGKIDRRALEQRAQETTAGAEILPSRAPETPVEERLAEIWRDVLGVSELGVGDDFFALGGDSILALQITSRAHRAGLRVTTRQIFEHPTVEGLAAVATAAEDDGEAAAEQGPVTGESPLTPIQHWFFHLSSQNPHHFTMPVLLELGEPWPLGRLQAALTAIVVHHDALRSRFLFEGGGAVRQIFLPPGPQEGVPFQVFDLRGLPEEPARRQLTRLAAGLQRRLHLSRGPLFRAVVFELPGELGRRLLLVAHHLVVDVISWQVVVQDLLALLREPEAPLSAKTTSFRTWAQRLRGWAGSPAARRQVSHWLAEADPPPALPRDFEDGENTEASATTLDLSLDPQNTERLVRTLPASGHGRLEEALLAAVTEAVGAWTGESRLWVDVEGHGRSGLFDDLDLSRTVGWFATLQPLAVDLRSAAGPAERLVAARRGLDQGGQAFGAVRFLAPDEELRRRLAALPPAPVLLNYLGQITRGVDQEATEGPAPLVLAAEDVGPIQDPRERRTHLLEINVGVAGERLEVAITYSRQVHREETVGRFGKELLAALRRFAAWCVEAPPAKGLAARPQISNLSGLDEREVQALSQRLEEGQQLQDVYPLSPLQQGMLFHALYQPSAGVYLAQAVVSFPRWLDLGAFAAAWRDVLDRFEVLRTGFVWEQLEHPQQVVVRGLELPLTVEDHRRLSPEDQRLRHDALLRRDRARGFDLQRPPLMRLHLTRQGDELWQMVWTFQQMLFDGWSLPLIYRDLMMLYDGHRRRQPPALPPAPPFRRYIAWLQEQDDAEAAEYWRRTLAGVEEPTPLPRDRVGVAAEARPEGYEEQRVFWTGRRAEELRQRARRGRFTLNTLIQGAWALALASYAGVGETVFGATVAGRPAELEDVEEMVGLFINTLPVRIPTRGRQTVGAWLQELQRQQLERQRFARLPLAEIQRLAGVASGRPLFETLLVVENYPLDAVRDGLQGEASDLSAAAAQELVPEEFQTLEKSSYPLSLIAHPETEVELVLAYYRRIFDPSTVGRLGRTLTHLAESLAGDLDRSLDAVPLLPPVEAHHLLVEANDSAAVIPAAGLAEVFEAQARRTPEAPAVVCRGETYDYRWLRDRAWKLASRLQGRGVSPGSRVAVLLERSAELPVALLAVLRAGAAYVPLDPSYPARRLRWMLDDSGAALAMGRGAPPAALDGWTGGWMDLASDDADGQAGAAGAAPAPASCSADRLAYLVYTSGSTGRPKGVGVSHGGVLRLVCNTDYLQVRPEDRVAHAADPAFDAATFELWAPLLNGGTVVVLEPAATQSPESLAAALEERQVNVLFLTTALFNQVVHHRPEAFRRLRCLLFGGEAVDPLRVRRLLADAPPRRLLHVYGPTEDTTFATWHRVTAVAEHAATVPIGRPVANTAVYVVDGGGRPVPRGAPGELLLGGPGLARGYLGRPARSAQVFVPNPFSSTPGERLYRTGDRVRTNHRGELEFLGRGDRQVKLRGFRIELGEVESVLASHPAVAEVAAMVHRSEGGEGKLVAYPVLGGSTVPSAADFRAFLAERLPDYMIPALYLPLKELPLTPHGKVDRAALPVPEGQRPDVSAPYEAPQGPVEEQLAEIWQEVLQLRRIGRRDNFFELGGDSILSIQISARGQRVGLRIRPRQVFEQPTVAQLAEVVEQISTAVGDLAAAEEIGELPLLPIQRWYFERRPSRPHHFNQSLLLHPRERLPRHGLTRAVRALMVRHGALRLRFSREGDKWSQEVLPEAAVSPVWIDLTALGAAGAEEMERLNQGFQTSLDLFRGPLLRCVGYDLIPAAASPSAAAEQRLLLVVHHLAVDGVSWRILLEDLQTAYSQLLKGEEIALLPTGTSLRRWAQGLEAYAESPQLAAEAEYWRAAARSGGVPLPRDFSSPRRGAEDSSVLEELSPESTEPLLTELPRAFGCRLDEALLGLLALVLAEWSGAQQ